MFLKRIAIHDLLQTFMVPGDIRRIEGTDTLYFETPDVDNSGKPVWNHKNSDTLW